MNDISFIQGAGILFLFAFMYWCIAKVSIKCWRWYLNRYLDKHPDVEQQLFLQHGKIRNK